jgi:hypothetical protein
MKFLRGRTLSARGQRYLASWEPVVGTSYARELWPARQVIVASGIGVLGGLLLLAVVAFWSSIPARGDIFLCAIIALIAGVIGVEAGFVLLWRVGRRIKRDLLAIGHPVPKWSPDLRSPSWFLRSARQANVDSESMTHAAASAAGQQPNRSWP